MYNYMYNNMYNYIEIFCCNDWMM